MDTYLARFDFGKEVISWLKKVGYNQAMHILKCVARILKFSEMNEDFFQGCGLYAVGSSLVKETYNDIDIALVGLDFRAVVHYDKIFLMDPETLIEKGVLVEPRCFAIVQQDESGNPTVLKPITAVEDPDVPESIEAWGRMGIVHQGVRYDYNVERDSWESLNLTGYCSYHAGPSSLTEQMHELFRDSCKPAKWAEVMECDSSLNAPFDNYGFGGTEKFLVYRFSIIEPENNLPGVKNSILQKIKPVDFSIHAENLYREEWKRHQDSLRLPYLTLREWSNTSRTRKIITELAYPRFIDPQGAKRAERDWMNIHSYDPDEVSDVVDV